MDGVAPPNFLGLNNLKNLTYHEGKSVYINESGFYRLINKSKTQLSDAFQTLVCDYVLPTLRRQGVVRMEGIEKQLEKLKLEQRNQSQIIEIKDQKIQAQAVALAAEEDLRKRAERKSLNISKLIKHGSVKEKKEEWIYIATTNIYSRERIFKIGSTERLVRRIDGYQTGRPKEDQYYYAYIKKVYASKDLDYHIQRLLCDFKHNEKGEMYIGIKFEDLCNIITVICENYDKSLDYVYGFVTARLPQSQEEGEDEPPPPIDISMITIHYGNDEEDIVLSEDSVKGMLQDILNNLECKMVDNVLVYQRKDLIEELGKIFIGSKRKCIWEATKKAIGWKSSKSALEAPELVNGSDMFMVQY